MKGEIFSIITLITGVAFFINAPGSDEPLVLFAGAISAWTLWLIKTSFANTKDDMEAEDQFD